MASDERCSCEACEIAEAEALGWWHQQLKRIRPYKRVDDRRYTEDTPMPGDDWANKRAREIARSVDCWLDRGGEDAVADAVEVALREAEQRLIDRLKNPDNTLVFEVLDRLAGHGLLRPFILRDWTDRITPVCRAVAATIEQENNDG